MSVKKCFAVVLSMACVLAVPQQSVQAWNNTGHMTVAMIAWNATSPQTRMKAIELLKQHPAWPSWHVDPGMTEEDANAYRFCQAATWPDAIRTPSNPCHADSVPDDHFLDCPFPPDPNNSSVPQGKHLEDVLGGENILKRIKACTDILTNRTGTAQEQAKQLCWLLHLAGDVHQPLHCASWFSTQFPEGDRGGNLVLVSSHPTKTQPRQGCTPRYPELHSYWDDLIGVKEDYAAIRKAAQISASRGRGSFASQLQVTDPGLWAEESTKLAGEVAYENGNIRFITEAQANAGQTVPVLSGTYAEKAKATAEERVALAGYRLADLLTRILGN